jgi:hypothetical protein
MPMMKFIILFLSILSHHSFALAGESTIIDNPYLGYVYQQKTYHEYDAQGDLFLLYTIEDLGRSLRAQMGKNTEAFMSERYENVKKAISEYPQFTPSEETINLIDPNYSSVRSSDFPLSLEGRQKPFHPDKMLLMFKQVIVEESRSQQFIPTLGKIHRYDPKIKKLLNKKFPILTRFSKLLLCLSRGVCSKYLISGKENELKKAIIARPYDSVTIEEMFRLSFKINQGDLYLSLLTIENVLSEFWSSPKRDKRLVNTRLKHITNFNYSTDKFGAWYHFFGLMLYSYAKSETMAHLIGRTENLGGRVLSRFAPEKQEIYINRLSSVFGHDLRQFIEKEKYKNFIENPEYIKEEFYMNLDEDFAKRIKKKNQD